MVPKIKAYITSQGEPTTDLAKWSLERLGFEVVVVYNKESTLWSKLKWIYRNANEDFIRMDADIIANKNTLRLKPNDECWWHSALGWDWFSQELKPISIHYIKKEALPYLRNNIDEFEQAERPETQVFRLEAFDKPRRCEVYNLICGLHGYKVKDLKTIQETKERRKQKELYDFELAERINEL